MLHIRIQVLLFSSRELIMMCPRSAQLQRRHLTNRTTSLFAAAENGDTVTVQRLLTTAVADPDEQDERGWTPLSWAAWMGHVDIVRLLVASHKVNPDKRDYFFGRSPLSWAAARGHLSIVQILLARPRIHSDSKDIDGRSPLSWAAGQGGEGWTPLAWAAWLGHESVVQVLLGDSRVQPDTKDYSCGWTPLSLAAQEGYCGIVQQLLAKGDAVDAHSRDVGGRTALCWAAERNHQILINIFSDREKCHPTNQNL